uniref:Uncharacterized protein n=1 Tax=Parascaris univalens TaxID=6257 RepID=A0A915B2Z0_PARUN
MQRGNTSTNVDSRIPYSKRGGNVICWQSEFSSGSTQQQKSIKVLMWRWCNEDDWMGHIATHRSLIHSTTSTSNDDVQRLTFCMHTLRAYSKMNSSFVQPIKKCNC